MYTIKLNLRGTHQHNKLLTAIVAASFLLLAACEQAAEEAPAVEEVAVEATESTDAMEEAADAVEDTMDEAGSDAMEAATDAAEEAAAE